VSGRPAFRRRPPLATPDRKTFRREERRNARKVTRIPFRSRRPVRTRRCLRARCPGLGPGGAAGTGVLPRADRDRRGGARESGPGNGPTKRRASL
jgi:hypothetical protein